MVIVLYSLIAMGHSPSRLLARVKGFGTKVFEGCSKYIAGEYFGGWLSFEHYSKNMTWKLNFDSMASATINLVN